MRRLLLALLFLVCVLVPARAAELPTGDGATGRKVFGAYCAKCHSLDPMELGKRGPHLAGLLQRRYGSVEGFPYRMVWPPAEPKWTPAHLDSYLEIHRLAEPQLRADVIAFLQAATKGPAMDLALGDPAGGERLFNVKCAYCHSLTREIAGQGPGQDRYEEITRALERRPWEPLTAIPETALVTERARRGPHLAELLTRAPGAAEGFPYRFVYEIGGPVWTAPDLDGYIEFHARLEPLERTDLITFLIKATR